MRCRAVRAMGAALWVDSTMSSPSDDQHPTRPKETTRMFSMIFYSLSRVRSLQVGS